MTHRILRQQSILLLCLALTLITALPVWAQAGIAFDAKLVAGTSAIQVSGTSGDIIRVYQFDSSLPNAAIGGTCGAYYAALGTTLSIQQPDPTAPGNTKSSPTIALTSAQQSITLANPLAAGTYLCLRDTTATTYSNFQAVTDPNDFGRFHSDFTAGTIISNQQQASSSATANAYLNAGFAFTWARAKRHWPGFQTLFNGEMSAVPVAAFTSTSTTSSTGATTIAESLNVLSSQNSARILVAGFLPIRATHWFKSTDWFTIAPIASGGFDTLLNPTSGGPSGSSSVNSSLTATSTNFNSVYNFVSYGFRFGMENYPTDTNEAPKPLGWLTATMGNYSNMPSYVCTAAQGATNPTGKSFSVSASSQPATFCDVTSGTANSSGLTSYTIYATRKLVPRVDLEAGYRPPNLPIALGIDANLSQYSNKLGFASVKNIDILNKPGNDVRIYIGYTVDLATLVKKLGGSN